jgi:hypothetical protein
VTLKHYYNGSLLTTAVLLDDEKGISAHATVGQVDTSTIYVQDPAGTYDFVAYKTWKMVEDACTAGNQVVYHGYVGDTSISRTAGAGYQVGSVARVWTIELIDDNGWPSRQVIIAASADRPAETVSARLTWLLTMRGMTGIIFDHGLVEACTTALDAKDCRNLTAKTILDDCALLSGFNWFVRYREASDDIELIFQSPNSAADPASLTISNVTPNLTTEWPPNDDAKQKFGASRIASGILLPYSGGTDYDQDTATAVEFGTVDQTAPTSAVSTKTKARAQITRLLAQHNEQDVSIEDLRIQIPAANLNDIKHGQYVSSVLFSHFKSPFDVGHAARVKSRAFSRPPNRSQAVYDVDLSLSPALGYSVCNAFDYLGNPITNTTDGFHPANFSATSRVDGLIQYVNPGAAGHSLPEPYHEGEWYFATYNVPASPRNYDVMGDSVQNSFRVFVVGPGTLVIHLIGNPVAHTDSTPSWDAPSQLDQPQGDITFVVPDDGECVHFVNVVDHGGTSGIGFALTGFTWTRLLT